VILDEILSCKREEIARLRSGAHRLVALADEAPRPRGFAAAIRGEESVSVIAEFKRRSPSAGAFDVYARPEEIAPAYERGGASAISILTDSRFFGGSLRDLTAARDASGLPILRKDFLVDPVQITEARAAGADAVLLIVRALEGGALEEMIGLVDESGMAAVVEVHDETELRRAFDAGAEIIGVNARDLTTFEVDLLRGLELAASVPSDRIAVAESGIRGREDAARAGQAGADAILVGGWLMRGDPERGVSDLVGQRRLPRPGGRLAAPADS